MINSKRLIKTTTTNGSKMRKGSRKDMNINDEDRLMAKSIPTARK